MIKIRYDKTTGKIGKSYQDNVTVPDPYFLMSDLEHNQLKTTDIPEGKAWYYINGQYLLQDDAELFKAKNNNKINLEIKALEESQTRSTREMIINPNDFAKNKLIEIDNQIKALRQQIIRG